MRVAREWQVPHSTIVRDWTSRDLSLAMAALLAKDDIGPCGHPHSLTTQPGAKDHFKVATEVCGACARLDEHRTMHESDRVPGTLVRVIDITAGDPDEQTAFGPEFD